MNKKKNHIEKIERLIESFSELIGDDLEEAKEILRSAGKNPEEVLKSGIRKLHSIQGKINALGQPVRATLKTPDGAYKLPFPVFIYDNKAQKLIVSDLMFDELLLTAKDVFNILVSHQDWNEMPYDSLIQSKEVVKIKLHRLLKELTFTLDMQPNCAIILISLAGTDIELSTEHFKLISTTGYFIVHDNCYPIDPESVEFGKAIMQDAIDEASISINTALNYFSKRHEYTLLKFSKNELDFHELLTSGLYDLSSALFTKDLYPYQKEGLSWLLYCCINRVGGILADDMGLGKTAQIIALIASIVERSILNNILIVVPSTLLENWKREFDFFAPSLKLYIHHGNERTGSPEHLKKQGIIVTSYSMIINDIYLFNKIEWGLTILDEASLIKNPESERRTALKNIKSNVRIAMTGTPVENSLIDLWSIADYVFPGYLNSKDNFRNRYVDKDIAASLENSNLGQLKTEISYIMLRRKKEDVLENLPDKIDVHQAITMHSSEAIIYEEKRNEILASSAGHSAQVLKLITELRMFTTHPLLQNQELLRYASINDLKRTSYKFSRMMELLHEISVKGEKVLIFTEFLSMIDVLQRVLSNHYGIQVLTIDGRIPTEQRQGNIDRFSAIQGFNIMALNPKTAGMGLNITASNHVIHYTRQWNPALEEQASARAYRNGQKKGVNIYYLYYVDTIEEVIDDRLKAKKALSGEVISVTETNDMDEYLNALSKSPLKK